jgi:glycosyltransferase involved in cell wall biosynthesis
MQLNNPLLSVIVPTFNAEKYLLSTLNSIQKQSLRSLEILVIDGGSKDHTADIAIQAGCTVI